MAVSSNSSHTIVILKQPGYHPQYFFWCTYDGQKIDLLELDSHQNLQALECKWQNRKTKKPAAFAKAYPEAAFTVINRDNYLEWITGT